MEEAYKRIYLVEQHLKEIQKDISNISTALIGNKENGNRGFIHELKDVKQEVTELKIKLNDVEDQLIEKKIYINQLKYVVSIAIGVIVTIIVTSLIKS
jgi:seryl-tRNA synthetase